LSQYIGVGWEKETLISASNQSNQTISFVVDVIAWYSVSAEEWETIDCFLLFQEIRKSPRKIQKPVTDLRSVGSLSWSASEYARAIRKRWIRVKDFERSYHEDIIKYEEQLSSEL